MMDSGGGPEEGSEAGAGERTGGALKRVQSMHANVNLVSGPTFALDDGLAVDIGRYSACGESSNSYERGPSGGAKTFRCCMCGI